MKGKNAAMCLQFTLLIVCDGVGGGPEGQACSAAVGQATLRIVRKYLEGCDRQPYALTGDDAQALAKRLKELDISGTREGSASTLNLLLLDHRGNQGEESVIGIWAGDSRSYLLTESGSAYRFTDDHHDEEGRLSVFYGGDGYVRGELGVKHRRVKDLCAACVTTDGVHDCCTESELYHFLLYCVDQRLRIQDRLSEELTLFLQQNLSDNCSLALAYRPLSAQGVQQAAEQMLPTKHA